MKITTSGYLIKNWLEGWKVLEVIKAWLVSENRGGLTKLRMYQSHPWFVHDGVLAGNILIGEGVANQPDKTKYWGKFWVSTYLDSWPWVHTLRDKLGWAMGGGSGAHGRGVESTPQSWASFKKSNTTFSLVLPLAGRIQDFNILFYEVTVSHGCATHNVFVSRYDR